MRLMARISRRWYENRLHIPDSNHVGDYVEEYGCFFDLKGNYLGHIVESKYSSSVRLLKTSRSKLRELRACLTISRPSVFKLPCAHCQLLLIDQEGSSMPSSPCN